MGALSNFLANRKTPGLNLDQLDLFEGRPVPTGLALPVPVDLLDEDPAASILNSTARKDESRLPTNTGFRAVSGASLKA